MIKKMAQYVQFKSTNASIQGVLDLIISIWQIGARISFFIHQHRYSNNKHD